MASRISAFREFECNEALLLLYLAGELPDEDRREVAQALASDASLRSQLESLRQLQGSVFAQLATLDANPAATGATGALHDRSQAARAAGRWVAAAVRRHALTPARQSVAADAFQHRLILRRVRYGLAAAAAAILISVLIWHPWNAQKQQQIANDLPAPTISPQPTVAEERMEQRLDHSFDSSAEKDCETLALSNSGLPLFSDNGSDDRNDGN